MTMVVLLALVPAGTQSAMLIVRQRICSMKCAAKLSQDLLWTI